MGRCTPGKSAFTFGSLGEDGCCTGTGFAVISYSTYSLSMVIALETGFAIELPRQQNTSSSNKRMRKMAAPAAAPAITAVLLPEAPASVPAAGEAVVGEAVVGKRVGARVVGLLVLGKTGAEVG